MKSDKAAKIGACVSGGAEEYIESLLKAGAKNDIDFFSLHPYQFYPKKITL